MQFSCTGWFVKQSGCVMSHRINGRLRQGIDAIEKGANDGRVLGRKVLELKGLALENIGHHSVEAYIKVELQQSM